MSKRKLPSPGTEEYDRLVALAFTTLAQEWSDVLTTGVHDYFGDRPAWRIGEHRLSSLQKDPDWYGFFVCDVIGRLFEKGITRWPEEDELTEK